MISKPVAIIMDNVAVLVDVLAMEGDFDPQKGGGEQGDEVAKIVDLGGEKRVFIHS